MNEIYLELDGVRKTARNWVRSEHCQRLGITYTMIMSKRKAGKSDHEILTTPKVTNKGIKAAPFVPGKEICEYCHNPVWEQEGTLRNAHKSCYESHYRKTIKQEQERQKAESILLWADFWQQFKRWRASWENAMRSWETEKAGS